MVHNSLLACRTAQTYEERGYRSPSRVQWVPPNSGNTRSMSREKLNIDIDHSPKFVKQVKQCLQFTWMLAAISAPNPDVNGASWAISNRPVFFTDFASPKIVESEMINDDSNQRNNKVRKKWMHKGKERKRETIYIDITTRQSFHFRVAPDRPYKECVSVSASPDRN